MKKFFRVSEPAKMSSDEQIKTGRFYDDESQTGFDRIKNLYKDYWNGVERAEIGLLCNSVVGTFCGGAMWRTLFGSNEILHQFHRRHNTSVFLGKTHAKREILYFTLERIFDRGIRFGSKCAALGGTIGFFTVHMLLYRRDLLVLDFVGVTSLAFALTRYNRGMRAFMSAGAIGFGFGLASGLVYKTASYYTNTTLKDSMDELNGKINRNFVEPIYADPQAKLESRSS